MFYLIFTTEKGLYLAGIPNNVESDLALVKVCNLLIKRLLTFSFLGPKGNLITTNFVSSNNHFDINNSSFFFVESKKRVIDERNKMTNM